MNVVERVKFIEQLGLPKLSKEQLVFLSEVIKKIKHNDSKHNEIIVKNNLNENIFFDTSDRLLKLQLENCSNGNRKINNLFYSVELLKNDEVVFQISELVNKNFKMIFHNVNLQELFVWSKLESKYSKAFFLFLLDAEKKSITVDFQLCKEILSIPATYRTIDIDKRVLDVIDKDMSSIFVGFSMSKVKMGRGNKIQSISVRLTGKYIDESILLEDINVKELRLTELELINKLEDL